VYELHGGCKTGSCIDCKRQYTHVELEALVRDTGKPPVCAECGLTRVKADVILFGEALPEGMEGKMLTIVLFVCLFFSLLFVFE
jgi:NAD-dependent SIR2 family protein deacetylase